MYRDLESLISEVLGSFLAEHEFVLASIQKAPGGGAIDVVYESADCKLRFYDSRRGGEINCLIGSVTAPNDGDWTAKENRSWFYLRDLLDVGRGLSLEELQKLMGPPIAERREQLVQIRDLLVAGFCNAQKSLRTRVAQ